MANSRENLETPQTMPRRKKRPNSSVTKEKEITPPILEPSNKSLKDNETPKVGREKECKSLILRKNSLVLNDISSELTSNSKVQEDFPLVSSVACETLEVQEVPKVDQCHKASEKTTTVIISNTLSELKIDQKSTLEKGIKK